MARCIAKDQLSKKILECLEMLYSSSSEEEDGEWLASAMKELTRYEQHAKKKKQQAKMKRKAEDEGEDDENSDDLNPIKKQKLSEFETKVKELKTRTDKSKSERCKQKVELFKELVADISQFEEE